VAKAERVIGLERLEQAHDYRREHRKRARVLVGSEGGLKEVHELVQLAGHNPVPVLITGETGTGKSLVASAIHAASPLRTEAFIQINCAAIPDNLMESELFGHEQGAFTGAVAARKGIFELAEGGTLFLDELGELPVALQSKLLGVLDDNRVRRLGGQTDRHVNVRVVAATNADLTQAVSDGRFRQDLFYRLGVILIHLPPLRHRLQDLSALCQHLVGRRRLEAGVCLAEGEIERLAVYHWPGNVRELKNVIERAIILGPGQTIRPSQLLTPNTVSAGVPPAVDAAAPLCSLRDLEAQHIQRVLGYTQGNQSQAARILGISRSTLLRKLADVAK
jgi:transcriptional regulator with PAS, ATPase and Fis domain